MTTAWVRKLLDEPTVCWGPPVRDGIGGYSSWPVPSQLNGRWEYNVGSSGPRVTYKSIGGAVIIARTSVWLDDEIEIGSYLWKGSLSSLDSADTPETVSARQVVAVRNIRSIVTQDYLYKTFLDER